MFRYLRQPDSFKKQSWLFKGFAVLVLFAVPAQAGLGLAQNMVSETPQPTPHLEYPVYFARAGQYRIDLVTGPTLDLLKGRRHGIAVSIDDHAPQVVDVFHPEDPKEYNEVMPYFKQTYFKTASDNARVMRFTQTVDKPGKHILKIIYNADGTIVKVPWWRKEGVPQIGHLNPYTRSEAETICWSEGIKSEPCSAGGMDVYPTRDGAYIKVKGVDFGDTGAAAFTASVASDTAGGAIELHLDGADGTLIGSVPVPHTGGWQDWKAVTATVSGAEGIHDLYLVFKGDSAEHLFNVDWWQFTKAVDRKSALGTETRTFEAEAAETVDGASKMTDDTASGGYLVGLTEPGQGLRFTELPAAGKLAIRYASTNVGTISVAVNGQPARKVNVHSSGAMTGSFLHAMIDVAIPTKAVLTIRLADSDVPVNIDRIVVGDGDLGLPPDIWNLPPLPVASGPYSPDWKEISRRYQAPEWWRDAKFGAWAHWDPQSIPEDGDWYARGMYQEGRPQYNYHVQHFGHPSEYGYKDICRHWVIDRWHPNQLMALYVDMGARYFMAMGCHHDNFDCFNSKYQPWNSVNVGPKVDIVGTWEKVARQYGIPFGIGFHDTPGRTWGQFMPVRYTSDKRGPKKGVPYDALQTILDGKGKWWQGMDPVDLYGLPHTMKRGPRSLPGNDPLRSPFANQFMWRVDDAITKYHPDVIYFDEHAGDSQVDLGVHMGLGFLGPQLAANYYNKSLQWNHGKMNVVLNLKGVGGRYNSFQDHPDLVPFVERSLVRSTEAIIEPQISAYPFQTETTSGDWHYRKGQHYLDARTVIRLLMENVSRNGSLLLNVSMHGRGNLDPEAIQICKDVGVWLKVNGEAIYASRPFEVSEENANAICYTRNHGNVYATLLDWDGGPITLKALHAGGATLGKVSKVEMLGSDVPLTFVQDDQGLTVTPSGPVQPLTGITNPQLAARCRVLRITHDKDWFNDDDPGATYSGWMRRCNLNAGDYNNDLTISNTTGDIWRCSFTGSNVTVIAPKEKKAGKIEVRIDGQTRATVDLSTTGIHQVQHQQKVCEVTGLAPGAHRIDIVNRGPGPVAVDAIVVR